MINENPIEIPESFKVLYTHEDSQYRYSPQNHVAYRYKLCDEMTLELEKMAIFMTSAMDMTKKDVLFQCQRGLGGGGPALTEFESKWVISRLEEVLDLNLPSKH